MVVSSESILDVLAKKTSDDLEFTSAGQKRGVMNTTYSYTCPTNIGRIDELQDAVREHTGNPGAYIVIDSTQASNLVQFNVVLPVLQVSTKSSCKTIAIRCTELIAFIYILFTFYLLYNAKSRSEAAIEPKG